MRTLSICLFILSVAIVGKTQSSVKRDSLLHALAMAKEDTNKVKTLFEVARYYQMNDQDSSKYYLDALKKLAEKIEYKKGIYRYYEQSVVLDFTLGNYTNALSHSDSAIRLARQLNDSVLIASSMGNLGITYGYLGRYNDELNMMLKATHIFEEIKDSGRLSTIYHNVANSYASVFQYSKSLHYALLSIRIHDQLSKPNHYINRVYSTAAQAYKVLYKYDSALHYFKTALSTSKQINDKIAEATIYGYLSDLYGLLHNFKGMLEVSLSSYAIAKELQSRQMEAEALNALAYANLYNGNMVQAKNYVQQAFVISTTDSLMLEQFNNYSAQSYIAAAEGDFSASFVARKSADSIQQAVLNKEVSKTSVELEKKYETQKKEAQIKQLEADKKLQQLTIRQKNVLNYILVAGAFVALLFCLLLYKIFHHKQKLQQQRISELETEKQLAATEAVLKGEETERTRLAKDLHDGLGGMLSGIKYSLNTMKGNMIMTPENAQAFERSIDMLDSSIQEMRRVAHNLMPEALVRFGLDAALQDFCNDVNQSGALKINYQSISMKDVPIEQTTAITIYRIVQELMNNTMKHAAAKNAIVQVTKTEGHLTVTVEDDGKGFDTALLQSSKGIGFMNIQHRVEFLKGRMDVDSESGKGTSVLIEIPAA